MCVGAVDASVDASVATQDVGILGKVAVPEAFQIGRNPWLAIDVRLATTEPIYASDLGGPVEAKTAGLPAPCKSTTLDSSRPFIPISMVASACTDSFVQEGDDGGIVVVRS